MYDIDEEHYKSAKKEHLKFLVDHYYHQIGNKNNKEKVNPLKFQEPIKIIE